MCSPWARWSLRVVPLEASMELNMEYTTFSYLEYINGEKLLELLRRIAKHAKKQNLLVGSSLSSYQNAIAVDIGFNNWSMLHKHLAGRNMMQAEGVVSRVLKHPALGPALTKLAHRTIDVAEAAETMRDWARKNYTPLVEFAFYDNESENGYGFPSVEMAEELADEFVGRYPEDLITEVGYALDANEGPWGKELTSNRLSITDARVGER